MKLSELPKLYTNVYLEFDSLRMMGGLQGVTFDCDARVIRKCRRVATADGWKWQIVDFSELVRWESSVIDDDVECLNELGMDLDGPEIVRKSDFLKYQKRLCGDFT